MRRVNESGHRFLARQIGRIKQSKLRRVAKVFARNDQHFGNEV